MGTCVPILEVVSSAEFIIAIGFGEHNVHATERLVRQVETGKIFFAARIGEGVERVVLMLSLSGSRRIRENAGFHTISMQ